MPSSSNELNSVDYLLENKFSRMNDTDKNDSVIYNKYDFIINDLSHHNIHCLWYGEYIHRHGSDLLAMNH